MITTRVKPLEGLEVVMSRTDELKKSIESINARDFVGAGKEFADTVKFHAPGLGLDVEGRDTVVERVEEFVRQADVRYDLADVAEHGPFVVGFARATGNVEGQRMEWEICEVLRYDGDQIAEVWALRGGAPRPTSAS